MLLVFATFIIPVSSVSSGDPIETSPDELLEMANYAFSNLELLKAREFYQEAENGYLTFSDEKGIQNSRNGKFGIDYILNAEYCYNQSTAFDIINSEPESNPGFASLNFSTQKINDILSDPATEHIVIDDGEIRYFNGFFYNYLERNGYIKEINRNQGYTWGYDTLAPLVYSRIHPNESESAPEVIQYHVQAELSLPHTMIPDNGTMKIWIPTPIETDSQTNVTVAIEPSEWVVKKPNISGDIGYAYLEVPVDSIEKDLNITCLYNFTSHERRNVVDPNNVGMYNVSDPEYQKFIQSSNNAKITPEITSLAHEIIGNETNPYFQAHLIYQYIIDTIKYSYVPHGTNILLKEPESDYVLKNHVGDCGSQAWFFVALCRSIGIPARTVGAMHDINGPDGYHAWAEVNIPGYGWIPVDTSIAELVENSYNATSEEREAFHEYFFGNQDPFRYYVQIDSDLPVTPKPRYDIDTIFFFQVPVVECNTSPSDLEWAYNWTVDFTREHE